LYPRRQLRAEKLSRWFLTLAQTITHAGFERDIISRRPTLYDDDGFEIDSDDDDEGAQAALLAAADFYPYSEIRIESKRL
jgi:hypothetical protein